jgi:type 1 glutamine amidotransferase
MTKTQLLLGAMLCGAMGIALDVPAAKPLRALYITGGCCHDYKNERIILTNGVSARAHVRWTVVDAGGSGTKHNDIANSLYQKADWARGYDVVVHNECFASDTDPEYIEKVLAPHRAGVAAVVVHCTMHTFRDFKPDNFREFLGVKSTRHGPQHPLDVKVADAAHPIMKGFPGDWKTGNEELYFIEKVWPTATVLATAADKKKDASGAWVDTDKVHPLIWVNTYGQGRVFGTTLAHANKTFEDPVFLDMFTRGLLWACGKLDDAGLPKPGYEASARK